MKDFTTVEMLLQGSIFMKDAGACLTSQSGSLGGPEVSHVGGGGGDVVVAGWT